MFDSIKFRPVMASSRAKAYDLISVTHSKITKKNELTVRISREAMDKAGLDYKDKVLLQFSPEGDICRIEKTEGSHTLTLSQQTAKNDMSPGILRVIVKPGMPNYLEKESQKESKSFVKVKYVHEDEMIEFKPNIITFKLKLDEKEEAKDEES